MRLSSKCCAKTASLARPCFAESAAMAAPASIKILPRLDEMVDGGLITLEKVRVILYRPAKK